MTAADSHTTGNTNAALQRWWLATALLVLAAVLRGVSLMDVPPGLTHDEAGHGHDAAAVLEGVTPIYFPVGYGREPLFDYLNAGLMAAIGPTAFTLRVSAWFWGVLASAVTYAVARKLFGPRVALWALAWFAVSFWPLATGRQALRSAMLPVFIGMAVLAFTWRNGPPRQLALRGLLLGLMVGAALYTYIPARVLWLMFIPPLLVARPGWRTWAAMLGGLALSGLVSLPLWLYLQRNPATEARLDMLDAPIDELLAGNAGPIVDNALRLVASFVVPGSGDTFLAYNMPGQPLLDPISGVLLAAGLLAVVTGLMVPKRRAASALALGWLALGLAPSAITGPAAMFTRATGVQPLVYALPAVGLLAARFFVEGEPGKRLALGAAALWLVVLGGWTVHDYFVRWGQSPDVRAAYQATLIAMVEAADSERPTLIGTVYPGVAHDAYIAELVRPGGPRLLFADTRTAAIWPGDATAEVMLSSAVRPSVLDEGLGVEDATVTVREGDLDPAYVVGTLPAVAALALPATTLPDDARWVDGVRLLAAGWATETARPGETARLWLVLAVKADGVGPAVPPAGLSELVLFTHLLDENGVLVAQRDALDAPSWQWQAGDVVVQAHDVVVPEDVLPGPYSAVVGLYDAVSGARLAVAGGSDVIAVPGIAVVE